MATPQYTKRSSLSKWASRLGSGAAAIQAIRNRDLSYLNPFNTSVKSRNMGDLNDIIANSGYDPNSYLSGLSNDQLQAILKEGGYFTSSKDWLGDKTYSLDIDSLLRDLKELSTLQDLEPEAPDYDKLRDQAMAEIQAENDRITAMYDKDLARQTDLYKSQMTDMNRSYNDYANNVLSNDYRNNAALMGAVDSSLSRARQSALEAGASAGIRLASNVNTILSVQNKQAQTSLETSNQLAQAMLNQRQAASNLRNDYSNVLSQDTANRAALENGLWERKQAAGNTAYNNAYTSYKQRVDSYNDQLAALRDSNGLVDTYLNNRKKQGLLNNATSTNSTTQSAGQSTSSAGY